MQVRKAAAALALSLAGALFIRGWEGTERVAYPDIAGVPTICTGSTKGVYLGQTATLAECEQRLIEDTGEAGKAIANSVKARVTQDQYDAMLSLTFNIGGSAFSRSTLVKRLNAGQCTQAADEFLRWRYAGGKPVRGLLERRKAERALFITGCTGD